MSSGSGVVPPWHCLRPFVLAVVVVGVAVPLLWSAGGDWLYLLVLSPLVLMAAAVRAGVLWDRVWRARLGLVPGPVVSGVELVAEPVRGSVVESGPGWELVQVGFRTCVWRRLPSPVAGVVDVGVVVPAIEGGQG